MAIKRVRKRCDDGRFLLDVDAEADVSAAEASNVLQPTPTNKSAQNHPGPPTVSGSGAALRLAIRIAALSAAW
jgi:hypothetical protein